MSSVTQRLRAFLRIRPPTEPVLIDGLQELERAYQIYTLLVDLEEISQARIIDHVQRICLENAQRRHQFIQATATPATTRPPLS
jgi:hypothetical protein